MVLNLILLVVPLLLTRAEITESSSAVTNPPAHHAMTEIGTILQVFENHITQVESRGNDVAFLINNQWIHYCRGRMLSENRIPLADRYDSIFYKYRTGSLRQIPSYQEMPHRAPDFFYALFGKKETDIRKHCRTIRFLGRSVFMNRFCIPALQSVEKDIKVLARHDKEVAQYIHNLSIAYSFKQKQVIGSENLSFHSFGLALDLVPKSYRGKQVYWRWSKVFRKDWYRIPLRQRWAPPKAVIDIFEKNGFVWGGKWCHFDTIHFEYRPEIIGYSRQLHPGDA